MSDYILNIVKNLYSETVVESCTAKKVSKECHIGSFDLQIVGSLKLLKIDKSLLLQNAAQE